MNIAETLIGKNMKAHPEALGLYIDLDEMYIAQTVRNNGGTELESLLRVPIPKADRSKLKPLELNEGFFAEKGWLEPLAKVATKKKWQNRKVVVSLASSFSLLRHFVTPFIERKDWKNAIPFQARRFIHFPFERTEYAFHVQEFETVASKQKRLGVVFTMTPKSTIEHIDAGLRSIGLDPVCIEPAALSLERVFVDGDKEAVDDKGRIYSFFGTDMASFVFINQNAPMLFREVEVSGTMPVERRRFEITNCTEFISKQLEKDPFEEAVIMGVDVDNWKPLLEADSKKPVRKWDLSEGYGIKMKAAGEIAAIGASLKFYDTKCPDLDFVKRNRLSDYEFNAALTAWVLTGIVSVLLMGFLVKGWWGVHAKSSQLSSLQKQQKTTLADFKGLTAQQIQSNLSRVKTQNTNLEGVLSSTYLTPLLSDLVSAMPEGVWVQKVSYKEEFPSKKDSPRSFILEGGIQTGNSEKDLARGKEFYDQLVAKPSIRTLCGSKAQIQYKDLTLLGDGGSNASAANKTPRKRDTSFIFTCDKKGGSK